MEGSPAEAFAEACVPTRFDGDRGNAVFPTGWAQGRASFGGLVVGIALVAARRRLPEARPLRAFTVTFPAPLAPGEVELDTRLLRHGRAVTYVQVEVTQGAEIGCLGTFSFGGPRPSAVDVAPPPRPTLPPPEQLPSLTGSGRTAPEFTRHFDYRLAFGAPPGAGVPARELGGWCRFHAEEGAHDPSLPRQPLGEEHVAGLVDAWPTPALSHLPAPVPAASMTWALELLEIEPDVPADGWWLYRADLEAAMQGYAHATALLWSPAGRLAALSRQSVTFFG